MVALGIAAGSGAKAQIVSLPGGEHSN